MERTFEYKGMSLRITDRVSEPSQPSGPGRPAAVRAPGAGDLEIEGLVLAADAEGYELTARVTGRNIAYVYTEVLLKDVSLDRFYGPVSRDQVWAEWQSQARGWRRPNYPVDLTARLRPRLQLLTDGLSTAFCFSTPEARDSTHGSVENHRRIEGWYTPAGGAEALRAVLTLAAGGEVAGMLVYKARGRVSTPRALSAKEGDTFVPLVQVLEPPGNGKGWVATTALSTPLAFRERSPRVITETLMPGDYLAGFVAQDLDGGFARAYASFGVEA
ncbi:MAG: hypothetical protein JXA87_09010 [Thermoleophilia bacterium]|nr:hypothetical protein [Thermoleophilia bacterium]